MEPVNEQKQETPISHARPLVDQRALGWAKTFVNDADPERKRLALASLQKNYPGAFGEHGLDLYTQTVINSLQAERDKPEFDVEEPAT